MYKINSPNVASIELSLMKITYSSQMVGRINGTEYPKISCLTLSIYFSIFFLTKLKVRKLEKDRVSLKISFYHRGVSDFKKESV